MIVNFIGNFGVGSAGEVADETHLAREMEALGHEVRKIPRDEWKAAVELGRSYPNIPDDLGANINLICKWHHFNTPEIIKVLREASGAPVFYWTWDWMRWPETNDWHLMMARNADVHLTNELGSFPDMIIQGVNPYYFPFDVSDGRFDKDPNHNSEKHTDVAFFGSFVRVGDRLEWLKEINYEIPVKIYGNGWEDWKKEGFEAYPAVYGEEFVKKVQDTKITLQFSVNDHIYGYWSNRVGKILTLGGFLLCRYIPGMELSLSDGVDYFSSVEEAIRKIKHYLENGYERGQIAKRGHEIGRSRFTSARRVKELMILFDRYLRGGFTDRKSMQWVVEVKDG